MMKVLTRLKSWFHVSELEIAEPTDASRLMIKIAQLCSLN